MVRICRDQAQEVRLVSDSLTPARVDHLIAGQMPCVEMVRLHAIDVRRRDVQGHLLSGLEARRLSNGLQSGLLRGLPGRKLGRKSP